MTTISLADHDRDEALQYALRRYGDESYREIMEAKRPKWDALIKSIQPATEAVQAAEQETK